MDRQIIRSQKYKMGGGELIVFKGIQEKKHLLARKVAAYGS